MVSRGRLAPLLAPGRPVARWLEQLVELQVVDRGAGLGAQAFSALLPLVIVYSSVAPVADRQDFSERLVRRLKLSGTAAAGVRDALAPSTAVEHSLTVVGFVLLVVATLTFARALQRMYEVAYGLKAAGFRGTPWHLAWIALIPIFLIVRPATSSLGGPAWHVAATLLLGAIAWMVTPYVLLGRRTVGRDLLPAALCTAIAMSALSAAAVIYLPHSLTSSAQQFGPIGIAFAILGWLVIAGYVLIGSTAAGAAALEWIGDRR